MRDLRLTHEILGTDQVHDLLTARFKRFAMKRASSLHPEGSSCIAAEHVKIRLDQEENPVVPRGHIERSSIQFKTTVVQRGSALEGCTQSGPLVAHGADEIWL